MNDINASVKIDWEIHKAAPWLSDIWETHHRKASARKDSRFGRSLMLLLRERNRDVMHPM